MGDKFILLHYNEIGAFFAYQELMKHITVYMPEMKPFTLDDVVITYADRGSYPNIPDVQLKKALAYKRLAADIYDGLPSEGLAFENEDASLPTILLMGDSYAGYGSYISRYIPEHFGRTVMAHWSYMEFLDQYIERFQPDMVLFVTAEWTLASFADSASRLQTPE